MTSEPRTPDSLPRVLAVSATPIAGEWATSALTRDLFATWIQAGDSFAMVTAARPGSTGAPAGELAGVAELALPVAGLRSPVVAKTVLQDALAFARSVQPEVVWLRSAGWPLGLEAVATAIAKRLRVPLVVHVMDDWPAHMESRRPRLAQAVRPAFNQLIRRADSVAVISESMARDYAARFGVEAHVVHGGADLQAWAAMTPRSELTRSSDRTRTLRYSGGVADDQSTSALDAIVASVERLRSTGMNLDLKLTVPHDAQADATRRWDRDGIEVEAFGSREQFRRNLREADALVLANNFDAASVSLLRHSMANKVGDYLASGTPILAFGPLDIATIDAAVSGGWAVVVSQTSPDRLDQAVTAILRDEAVRSRVSDQAAIELPRHFDIAGQRERLETLLTETVSRARPR